MEKDSNIRVFLSDRKALRKIAKKEGRTLKFMFGVVVNDYITQNESLETQ